MDINVQGIIAQINEVNDLNQLNELKALHLGKKSELSKAMGQMGKLAPEERAAFGQKINALKKEISDAIDARRLAIEEAILNARLANETIDISLEGQDFAGASKSVNQIVVDEIIDICVGLGYQVAEGPEVESDHYNFELLNLPADHPARDMQDTFYIDETTLLRTHTSPVQARVMEKCNGQGPIKIICPGKVYRRDDDDATHSHQFMQIEGLVVDKNITMADLKGTLDMLAKKMFGEKRTIRLRSSYFPFTEPSVEVDVSCYNCDGKGCNICKGTGWIEILGAGMVHPNVLRMSGIDPKVYQGFAFGIGVERIAMLRYGIDDIRHLYTNDLRFLKQFNKEK
ncbi:MAG: phenylalanine--tRNA ligase subunit alpha [Bacilli bacterium]|nr:phenylalanine--tRNA ligase subunit alpha [Bacilli bacterium]